METKVVVASFNASGEPDFYFCKIECTEQQYNNGEHYERAEKAASENGYEGPMVAFDQKDPPKPLFDLFKWDSASVFKV
jgi:hypothetical protein